MKWYEDGRKLLAAAVVFAAVLMGWLFKYETYGPYDAMHRNRITGATCPVQMSCWFSSRGLFDPD